MECCGVFVLAYNLVVDKDEFRVNSFGKFHVDEVIVSGDEGYKFNVT